MFKRMDRDFEGYIEIGWVSYSTPFEFLADTFTSEIFILEPGR
jgi:hypothetical protein